MFDSKEQGLKLCIPNEKFRCQKGEGGWGNGVKMPDSVETWLFFVEPVFIHGYRF